MRFLLMPVLILALAGCAGMNTSVFQGGTSLTASVQNPVGRSQMAAVESAYRVAVVAAVSYRRHCYPGNVAVQPIPVGCSNRSGNMSRLQSAYTKARAAVLPLRSFVRDNESVSAISALSAARAALAEFQSLIPGGQ